jgi:signal transduction histidine kinase
MTMNTSTSTTTGRVLVIDDERGPRESLRILLKNDYQVACADSVDAGLELLAQHQPDTVIMDIRMPGRNGIEGLRAIREMDSCVSVIMFTGFGALETAQEAIRLGANDYLKKPLDTHEIQAVVRHNVRRAQLERRRRDTEHELARLNQGLMDELAQKDRMASLGQKSAEMAHDLRNPLTAVLGYVELLARDLADSKEKLGDRWKETAEYLDIIEHSINRCKELSDMWLRLGKDAAPQNAAYLIRDILQDVVRDTVPLAARHDVKLEFRPDGNCTVRADRLQITRAVQNLVVNAIEAAPAGTGEVQLWYRADGDAIEIGVADNGCGISSEKLPHVFHPFYTTKGQSGTGLGLFIAKQTVEANHGTLSLDSEVNRGTTARVRLPACAA